MSLISSIISATERGKISINGHTCNVSSNKIRKFTDKMETKGFDYDTTRPCRPEEVTQYLQAINGILPKKLTNTQVPIDFSHTYEFTQVHGVAEIYDRTAEQQVVRVYELGEIIA